MRAGSERVGELFADEQRADGESAAEALGEADGVGANAVVLGA